MSAAPDILSPEAVTGAHGSSLQRVFGVIYCDPPWRYDFAETDNRAIENKYPTMSIDELCALKVPGAKDSVLYLWATAPKLLEAVAVIAAWGYTYKTHGIWDKEKVGMGYWFRGQHELLMVATRGKMSPPAQPDRIGSVIRARRGSHSSKPDQVRDWIAKWYPNERKLEMFARPYTEMWPKHDGWETWGNELTNDVAMTPNDRTELRLPEQRGHNDTKNMMTETTVGNGNAGQTLPPAPCSASWGVTRRYGKLITDGEKLAVQIEIEAKDERRLQVLLSKAMSAVAYAEEDVNLMTESTITKYLDDQSKCYVTVTPNGEFRRTDPPLKP